MFETYDYESDKFNKYFVTNFIDYLKIIKEINSKNKVSWFRGQSSSAYRLIPSAMREMVEIGDMYNRKIKPRKLTHFNNRGYHVTYINYQAMLEEFKKEAIKYLRVKPQNDFEWSFIAQHYGVPTKLLDWTTDPLVALFFALPNSLEGKKIVSKKKAIEDFEKNGFSDLGACVFVIDPFVINEKFSGFSGDSYNPKDVNKYYNLFEGYIHPSSEKHFMFPYCILGSSIDRRICRQSGNFTIHGQLVWPIDFRDIVKKEICKIFIPYACIVEMKEWLNSLNITKKSIYGDSELDLIASQISEKEREKFRIAINTMIDKYKNVNEDKKN